MSSRRVPLARWSRRVRIPALEGELTVTVLVSVAVLWAVDAAGLLPVFAVQFRQSVDPWLIVAIVGAALGVPLIGGTLATLAVASTPARATGDTRGGLDD